MADLQQSRDVLIDQTVTCLALFALSTGQLPLGVDCSRYVLKRQEGYADAGIWIMRGLGFAAMGEDLLVFAINLIRFSLTLGSSASTTGVPYLTLLHFRSALSANRDYEGLKECLEYVQKVQEKHTTLMMLSGMHSSSEVRPIKVYHSKLYYE